MPESGSRSKEDDPAIRSLRSHSLTFRVDRGARRGRWDVSARAAGNVHARLAVLDLGLPFVDRFEPADRLRAKLSAVRLVALTGYGRASVRERTRSAAQAFRFTS